jgi:hypothetical protein
MNFKRLAFPVLLMFLLNSTLTAVGRAGPLQKPTPQGTQFDMKYEEGTKAVEKGKDLKVTVGNGNIVCSTKESEAFSIPIAAVIEVSYDVKVRRRLAEAAAVAWASLGAAAVLAVLKTKKHFVNILWEEDGAKKEVVFKVGKGEYKPFLAELRKATGKEWKNLPKEREMLKKEIEQEKKNTIALQLDRGVHIGAVDLNPGLYQLVLLNRGEGKGELCFFPGKKVEAKKIAAGALVEIVDQANQLKDAQAVYNASGQVATLAEIRTPTKTLRLL